MKYGKMPNAKGSSKGHRAKAKKPYHTGGGDVKLSNEMRSDTHKQVSNRHPYPTGMS